MELSIILIGIVVILVIFIKRLNRYYDLLALCKRIRTLDGSPLQKHICTIPGSTIFGNNFDLMNLNMEKYFNFCRNNTAYSKGESYLLNFLSSSVYNVCTAEDAEEVLQSQQLITKNIIYRLVEPFMGDGLLTSTDKKWHSRRKMLTPAFHFNILQNFLNVFKEESVEMVKVLNRKMDVPIKLEELIPEYTLNNVCDTAMGVKLSEMAGNAEYRQSIHEVERILMKRLCNPLMVIFPTTFRFSSEYASHVKNLRVVLDFSSKIIQKKRVEFQRRGENDTNKQDDDLGQKRRAAMLDTLLVAEKNGLIDHEGICDEVNTFMFEGYDTTSTCLIFTLLSLANYSDIQEKCYKEISQMDNIENLTLFDFNQVEYLECVIKEVLRLYPSVPFIGRQCVQDTVIRKLFVPAGSQINVHIYDVMRDPRHFPDPNRFDPNRFLPENCVNRHPFAYIPFSAGPRNCIGQKFAILEMKVILMSILKNFVIMPVTRIEDVIFENGIVLRTQQKVEVKFVKRVNV